MNESASEGDDMDVLVCGVGGQLVREVELVGETLARVLVPAARHVRPVSFPTC